MSSITVTNRNLEYDFVVSPGANPGQIGIAFDNASRVRIDQNGDLLLKAGKREIRQRRPVAYQETSSGRIAISVDYVLLPGIELGFGSETTTAGND